MILILYATQTGNSKMIADIIEKVFLYGYDEETIYNTSNEYNNILINKMLILKISMDEFQIDKIKCFKTIIFVCSTHGDGDEPFSMRSLWNFLKLKVLPKDFLCDVKFAVYGLGDSSYDKFNYCGKKLFNRLISLGGNSMLKRGDGDLQDKEGYFTSLRPWIKELYNILCVSMHSKQFISSGISIKEFQKGFMTRVQNFEANIITIKKMTPEDYKNEILNLSFKIKNYKGFYPGDCIAIMPKNYNYNEFIDHNKGIIDCVENVKYSCEEKNGLLNSDDYAKKAPSYKIIDDDNVIGHKNNDAIIFGKSNNLKKLSEDKDYNLMCQKYHKQESINYNSSFKVEKEILNFSNNIDEIFKESSQLKNVADAKTKFNDLVEENFNRRYDFNESYKHEIESEEIINEKNKFKRDHCKSHESNEPINDKYECKKIYDEVHKIKMNFYDKNLFHIKNLIQCVYDINFVPHQYTFLHLLLYIKDKRNNIEIKNIKINILYQKLEELFKDYSLYYDYILKPRRTFFEVLKDFNIKIDIYFLIKYVPKLRKRYFTTTKINDSYHIYVSLLKYNTGLQEPRKGICSEYLKNLSLNDCLEVSFGKSCLYLNSKKLLFICTGTGITLPWAVINFFKNKECILFYGFRYLSKDRLFSNELKDEYFYNSNKLKVYEAPSREKTKKYVQHIFKQHSLANIEEYGIFVSGNSALNKEIRKNFHEIYGRNVHFQSETW